MKVTVCRRIQGCLLKMKLVMLSHFFLGVQFVLRTVQLFLGNNEVLRDEGEAIESGFVALFYALTPPDEAENPYYKTTAFPGEAFLTFEISLDSYPREIGVELRDSDGTVIFYRPPRFYVEILETLVETISIPEESRSYTLKVADTFGDGLAQRRKAGYKLYEGSAANGTLIVESNFESVAFEETSFTTGIAETSGAISTRWSVSMGFTSLFFGVVVTFI